MIEVIVPALVSGASSAFVECAIKAITEFIDIKNSLKRTETSQTEIRRYVDDYLNKYYPTLIDHRYINDKLYEFMLSFIKYVQPQMNFHGNVIVNLIVTDKEIENTVFSFLELPENQKWNEIKFLTREESSPNPISNRSENIVDSLRLRAQKIGLQLDISDKCSSEKIEELFHIIEKYEAVRKKGSNQ